MTTLEKIGNLEARLAAKNIALYWIRQFAFGRQSAYPYQMGRVTQIRAGEVHFSLNATNSSIPLTWLHEYILLQLWDAYKLECREHFPHFLYEEIIDGLE